MSNTIAKTILFYRWPLECVSESYFIGINRVYLSSSTRRLLALSLTTHLCLYNFFPTLYLLLTIFSSILFFCPLTLTPNQRRVSGDRRRQAPPALSLPPFLPCSLYEYNHRPNLPLVSESICVSHISTRLLVIKALQHTWVGHISVGFSSPPLPPCVCLWAYRWGFMSIMREWEWGHQSSGLDATPQQQPSNQYERLL